MNGKTKYNTYLPVQHPMQLVPPWVFRNYAIPMKAQSKIVKDLCVNSLNTLKRRQNNRHFPDHIFKGIFLNENVWILIKFQVPTGSINYISALVHTMVWRRQVDKQLSEPMMCSLFTHICVTRPQWVKFHFIKRSPVFVNIICTIVRFIKTALIWIGITRDRVLSYEFDAF